jgi:hypothetical protein
MGLLKTKCLRATFRGAIVGRGTVLAAGVIITCSTAVHDLVQTAFTVARAISR